VVQMNSLKCDKQLIADQGMTAMTPMKVLIRWSGMKRPSQE